MTYEQILLSAIFVPITGAFLVPLAGRVSRFLRNGLSLVLILFSFSCSLVLLPHVFSGQPVFFSYVLPLGLDFVFVADKLAVFMSLVSTLISSVIIFYSFGYISHYENQNEYYCMVVLFLGAMVGLVFSANLIFLYLFWEITAVTSWRLIGFFRERKQVLKADKAFLVTVFGALLMLLGFVQIYQQTGTFVLTHAALPNVAVVLILCGILSKSATLPFHTWLPDAGVAPSPVTALLHAAILVKIGVYVYARLFISSYSIDVFWQTAVPVIAAASALVSAGAALVETDLKRLIAYSTVSQIGFIFFGLAIGNEMALVGGLLYILMHGLAKAGLFLCAGIVEQNAKTKNITELGGLMTTMPKTAISFLLCAFSVMGIPPFGGFFSKYMVFSGAIEAGQVWISLVFLIGAFMTILYLFRVFNMVFLGESKGHEAKEQDSSMVFSVVLLAILSLVGGILIAFPSMLAHDTAVQMLAKVIP
jgi:proton-translocating NADH-quinone oxidoreductase chain N